MAAVNKDPFVYSKSKDGKPSVFRGLVQAGSTAAIKVGEICTWNETTGYFIPVNAVADHRYPLAISKEEQKSSGRGELTASRYIEFYDLDPNDVFEFELAASAQSALGDPYTLTASNSQKLTAAAGAFAVAINVDDGYYPQEEDTTLLYQDYARVTFNPAASYWGYRRSQMLRGGRRIISGTTITLAENDMYNTLLLCTATGTVTLPAVKPGMDIIILVVTAAKTIISPNASDKIRVKGAQLADDKDIDNDHDEAAGDWVQIITESADGFVALGHPAATWATV